MIKIKNNIISVKSTLGKKDYGKRRKKGNKTSGSKAADNTKKLRVALVVIPLLMAAVISTVLFFAIKQFVSVPEKTAEESGSLTEESFISDKDAEKLLMIVSPNNPLPSDYRLNLISYQNIKLDSIVLNSFNMLLDAAKNDGISLNVKDGYVSTEEQNELYNAEVRKLTEKEGYTRAKAEKEAEKTVPMGNHAEQQSGLSVQFTSSTSKEFDKSKEYLWLIKNSYKYGFVVRYPEGKEDYTDMPFNPQLFRYVGNENALKMTTLNLCLDEYVSYLNSR